MNKNTFKTRTIGRWIIAFWLLLCSQFVMAQTHTVVLLDNTGSQELDVRQKICEKSVWALVDKLENKDSLDFVALDDVKWANKHRLNDSTIVYKYSGSELESLIAKKGIRKQVKDILDKWYKTSTNQTLVADAVVYAADIFMTSSQKPQKQALLICSDMIEESKIADMKNKPVTLELLKRFEQASLIPIKGMENVEVRVVALGGGVPLSRVREVEDFWREYFSKSKAKISLMSRTGLDK